MGRLKKCRDRVFSLGIIVLLMTQLLFTPFTVHAESPERTNSTTLETSNESFSTNSESKDYEEVVKLEKVTEETVDTKTLSVDEKGVVHYNGKPLYAGKGDEKIPATLDGLMKKGVTQELVPEDDTSIIGGIVNSILGFFAPKFVQASDAAPVIKYNGQVSFGWTTVGDFTVDGVQAFCIEHEKSSPPSNTPYNSVKPYDNEKIQKALYYGWGGPKNVFSNRSQGIVITSSVLSRIYTGVANGESNSGYDTLWDKVQNGTLPNDNFRFTDTDLSVSIKGGKQVTQSTTLDADPSNSTTFSLPSGVTLVNESTGTSKTGGSVTIKGGQKFHLEAPLTRSSNFNSGTLSGSMSTYQPMVVMPKSSGYQDIAFGRYYKDPDKTASFVARFTLQQVTHTVKHIDNYTKNVIKTTNTARTIGSDYKVCPATNLSTSGHSFSSTNSCVSGKTPSSNFTTTFYYNTKHTLIINYYDNYNKKFIKEWGRWTLFAGSSYDKNAHTSFVDGTNKTDYTIVGSNNVSGKMGRANKTVNLYFDPYHDISVVWKNKYPNYNVFQTVEDRLKVGSLYTYTQPETFHIGSNAYVRENNNTFSGTLGYSDLNHEFFYKLRRQITVNYLDNRTGEKITDSKIYTVRQGDIYSEKHLDDITKGNYIYRYIKKDGDAESGTVGTSHITINYYYDIPLVKVGLKKIQVYTAPADQGLPVKINLSKEYNYPESISDMDNAKLNVSLYQGSKQIASNTYTAKSLPDSIDFKVPPSHLSVNQKKAYTVKFESFSKNDIDVNPNAASITTDGYTSSEETLNVNSTSLSFTGVIMTEREVEKNMVVFNESLQMNLKELDKKITGYGFTYPIDVIYTNDLGQKFTSKFEFYVPKSLVDTYLSFPVVNNFHKISFDETSHNESEQQLVLTTKKHFELPKVNIEKQTGNLFSNSQVSAGDNRIKYDIIDGGRKFYTPIWGDLGTYQLDMKNVDPLGVHKINVSMTQNLEIYAYMYGHMDSNTGEQDAIYLRPINADDPKYPDNWTAEDKRRFEEWNQN